ncbi:hypothetical protein RRF57_000558 [Xylaria bambusicola]|uniref:Uncharacterized protein n=1 Tax=Xylaria bambusicola TaxID=326684 RepID=A0AAN7YZS5_9PEZI
MAVPVHSNPVGVGRVADIDGNSDYGSDFSVGEEQLVEEILASLASANTTKATDTQPSATARTPARQGHDGESCASASAAVARQSSHTAGLISPGLTQLLPTKIESTTVSPLEQGIVLLDSVRYPDCKCTVFGYARLSSC